MTKEEAMDIIADAGFGFFATVEGNKPFVASIKITPVEKQ